MKRFLTSVIAFFILSGALAQQNSSLSYKLDLRESITVPVILRGPTQSCQSVPLLLDVSYQPVEEIVKVEVRYDNGNNANRIKPVKMTSAEKKSQITYLLFPISWNEVPYKNMGLKSYFKDNYSSKVVFEPPMREQIAYSESTDIIRPAFQFLNGELLNSKNEDIMFSLSAGKKIVMEVKVSDLDKPVVLKINNVIPLRTKSEYSLQSNKFYLKYISNPLAITFNLPDDPCAKQYTLIEEYKEWNKKLNKDLGDMYSFDPQRDKAAIVRKKFQILNAYKEVRRGITATNCDNLQKEYSIFQKNYDKIGEGLITADSLQKIFDELDELYDNAFLASNNYDGKSCNRWKQAAEKFNALALDEEAYEDSPEEYDLVSMINERLFMINNLECRGSSHPYVVTPTPTPPRDTRNTRCNVDTKKILKAADDINNLVTKYWKEKKKDDQAFSRIVHETDDYLNSLPESCKNNDKYKPAIDQYQKMKNLYLKRVK